MEIFVTFLLSVLAGITANYIFCGCSASDDGNKN